MSEIYDAKLADLEKRLRVCESYKSSHDAEIGAWWREQWKQNSLEQRAHSDHEDRLRMLEKWQQRAIGMVTVAAAAGSLIGGGVVAVAMSQLAG